MDKAVIVTFSGKEFDVVTPDLDEICLEDIAHALSQTCRFTGHTEKLYSVAEHSVLCSNVADTIELQRACLLHDAAEAYLNDIASPVKRLLPKYEAFEEVLLLSVFRKYGLAQFDPWDDQIKYVDRWLLRSEIHQLMPQRAKAFDDIFCEAPPDEAPVSVYCWPAAYAKKMFLQRAEQLNLED